MNKRGDPGMPMRAFWTIWPWRWLVLGLGEILGAAFVGDRLFHMVGFFLAPIGFLIACVLVTFWTAERMNDELGRGVGAVSAAVCVVCGGLAGHWMLANFWASKF